MPVTIKQGQLKYKNSSGQYVTFNAVGEYSDYPTVKRLTVTKSSSQTYTIPNNSRIRIDCFGGQAALLGSIYLSANSSGTITNYKLNASNVTITVSTNSLTVANANASADLIMYCNIYAGDMT